VLSSFNLERRELYRAFNMGIGMVLACAGAQVGEALALMPSAVAIGRVEPDAGAGRVQGLW
jgi:phosphoribosylaminoimidazole (AIR) synthetase